MKTKAIRLTDGHGPLPTQPKPSTWHEFEAALRYKVEEVTNSVEYLTGHYLERDEVKALCDDPAWTVSIVPRIKPAWKAPSSSETALGPGTLPSIRNRRTLGVAVVAAIAGIIAALASREGVAEVRS